MPALYAIGLLIAFYAIAIAEIFIPSGGFLGLTAVVVAVTSIIIGYTSSGTLAVTLTLIYVITTPILIGLLIRLWPNTKIGRHMLNRETLEADSALPELTTIDGTPLSAFVGRIGTATSNLLPGGEVRIDGHRTGAISTGLPIDTGTLVRVVRLHSGKLQVRAASDDESRRWHEETAAVPSSSAPASSSTGSSEPSSQPDLYPPDPTPQAVQSETPIRSVVTSSLDDVDFDLLAIDVDPNEGASDDLK